MANTEVVPCPTCDRETLLYHLTRDINLFKHDIEEVEEEIQKRKSQASRALEADKMGLANQATSKALEEVEKKERLQSRITRLLLLRQQIEEEMA